MYPTSLDHTRVSEPLKYEIVTQPAVEPVLYSDLYDWLRLLSFDDRNLTVALETVGRMYVEQRTRQTLITTVFNLWLDFFPTTIIIPARPLQTVNFISYIDGNNATQTLDPSRYLVDAKGPRPTIIPPLGSFFPIAKVQQPNAVQINFTAGFGSTGASVPAPFLLMIKQWCSLNYDNRQAIVMGKTPAAVPHTFDALLRLFSLPEV